MKKLFKFDRRLKIVIIMLIAALNTKAQIPSTISLYDTVFVEEFNGSTLNASKWLSMYPWGGSNFYNKDTVHGWCNSILDLASIKDTNMVIDSGMCKLIGKKGNNQAERWRYYTYPSTECSTHNLYAVPWDPDSSNCLYIDTLTFKYSNAMLMSKAKFKYGYFETKFRLPGWTASTYNGYSPTFWLYNNHHDTMPWSEIDVFEINAKTGMFTNNIWIDGAKDSSYADDDPIEAGLEPFINLADWHTASVNWTPYYIDFYLDGAFIRRSDKDTNKSLIEMPFIIENYISAPNFCVGVDQTNTTFPVTYELEYVKVYQPKLDCSTNKVYLNVTQATYDSKVYKSLTMSGSGYSATFNNDTINAVATDYILLNEGFEIGSNITMEISVGPKWCEVQYIPNSVVPTVPNPDMLKIYTRNKKLSNE